MLDMSPNALLAKVVWFVNERKSVAVDVVGGRIWISSVGDDV